MPQLILYHDTRSAITWILLYGKFILWIYTYLTIIYYTKVILWLRCQLFRDYTNPAYNWAVTHTYRKNKQRIKIHSTNSAPQVQLSPVSMHWHSAKHHANHTHTGLGTSNKEVPIIYYNKQSTNALHCLVRYMYSDVRPLYRLTSRTFDSEN